MQTVHLSAHTRIEVVKTKIELDSHSDACIEGNHCVFVHDHKRLMNVYGYNTKAGSKHVCVVDATVAYIVPETGHVVILPINQAIEMKGLDHHLLCQIQCHVNAVLIDEVPEILAPVPSETMHAIEIKIHLMPSTQ